jgi:cytochrome c oxidase subunit 2
MRGKVIVQEESEYQAWLQDQAATNFARLTPGPKNGAVMPD